MLFTRLLVKYGSLERFFLPHLTQQSNAYPFYKRND